MAFPSLPQTFCSFTHVTEQFPTTQNTLLFALSAACHRQFPPLAFLPFSTRHQKRVVESPSLNSPKRSAGDGRCWANLQNTHFSGLTRKNPAFERSVLKYVSIKNRILTQSGQKSRVCVNQPDRLLPHHQIITLLLHKQIPKHARMVGHMPGARWILFSGKEDKAALRECARFSRCDEGSYG